MVLTVTLNPLFERRFEYDNVVYGTSNRNSRESILAGGKGINVSRQLNRLGITNTSLLFTGGSTGKQIKKLLDGENIAASFVQIKDETRNGTVIVDKNAGLVTSFFGRNSEITSQEAGEFLSRLEKMIANSEIVVLSGSSPSQTTDHIFPAAVEICNKQDKISVLDTYGNHLEDCLGASPTIIHNNLEEISGLLSDRTEKEILGILDILYAKRIKQVYITDGPGTTYASNFDFHFKITPPSVKILDATGSGDAFTAGLVYGWHNNLTFEDTSIIASCLGTANAVSYKICSASLKEAGEFKQYVKIESVGKKIKTINVDSL